MNYGALLALIPQHKIGVFKHRYDLCVYSTTNEYSFTSGHSAQERVTFGSESC